MIPPLPDWLPCTTPEANEILDNIRAELKTDTAQIFVSGHRSMATSGTLAREHAGDVIVVRLAGCHILSDAVLAMGLASGSAVPGGIDGITKELLKSEDLLVVIDARSNDTELPRELVSTFESVLPHARWLTSLDLPTTQGVCIPSTVSESPVPTPLPPEADMAAWLPGGSRIPGDLPETIRDLDGPVGSLNPTVVRQLNEHPRRSTSVLTDEAIPAHQHLLDLATGQDDLDRVTLADLFVLLRIAEHGTNADQATLAAAAAARIRSGWGQNSTAMEQIEQNMQRAVMAEPTHRATLLWAEARIHLDQGNTISADARFETAANLVRGSRDLTLLACMHRRWGDALTARGILEPASRHYRDARALYRQRGDGEGMSATLRGSADVAVAAGEVMSAEALYDQAEMSTTSGSELANRRIGWASLALNRGNFSSARKLLDDAQRVGGDARRMAANIARRRADIHLREGQSDEALEQARIAADGYTRCGDAVAAARCERLIGDALAIQGHLPEAAQQYQDTMKIQVQCGDSHGLHRTVRHAATLEHLHGDPDLADVLRRTAETLEGAARP